MKIEILKKFRVSRKGYAGASELRQAGYLIQTISEIVGVSRFRFYRWRRVQAGFRRILCTDGIWMLLSLL